MKQNIGTTERYIRSLLGLTFFLNIFILQPSRVGTYILLALALIMFYTAYYRYCLIYEIIEKLKGTKGDKVQEKAEAGSA